MTVPERESGRMISADEMRAELSTLGDDVQVDIRSLPSGVLSAEVRRGSTFVVIDGTSDGQWGVAAEPGDWAGYDEVHTILADAVEAVRLILTSQS
jgi:hypothetical protein